MYEYISGSVAELAPTYAVIDAGGVGYYLNISLTTYAGIEHAERARLYVHYVVREDAQLLYGFSTKTERELFRLLLSVSGVGGNTARMILSAFSPRELQSVIASENAVLLKNVKGLGLKTAQKIIVELSGKMATLAPGDIEARPASDRAIYEEATAALVMLGFPKSAAEKAVTAVLKETPDAAVEDTVRLALERLQMQPPASRTPNPYIAADEAVHAPHEKEPHCNGAFRKRLLQYGSLI